METSVEPRPVLLDLLVHDSYPLAPVLPKLIMPHRVPSRHAGDHAMSVRSCLAITRGRPRGSVTLKTPPPLRVSSVQV